MVSAEHLAQRSQRYRGQMAAYAYALEEVTGIPVVRRVLWFWSPTLGWSCPESTKKTQ